MGITRRRMMMMAGLAGAGSAGGAEGVMLEPGAVGAFREAVRQAVWDRVIGGGSWWLERKGQAARGAYGFAVKAPEEMKTRAGEGTVYDAASLTKVMATTPCVMRLVEEGMVELERPVRALVPEFAGEGRERITVRQLLTHTSGLKPGLSRAEAWEGWDEAIRLACATEPLDAPDAVFRYSDINFILLGEVVRRAAGKGLEAFAREAVFEPLGMADTGFRPGEALRGRIAATERDEAGRMLRGEVHDPTARRMGGVAGHAGLFTTARDAARYARSVVQGGALEGRRILREETVRRMTAVATPKGMEARRALGWDVDTTYSRPRGAFPAGKSFGHTGFTGCCLWIDPGAEAFYVFLGNRLHETDPKTDSRMLYEILGEHAGRAAGYGEKRE
jgi:CubicO group peptidase (beta-lactamase class C family)